MPRKAVPNKNKLRVAFSGVAGSGKTWTSLNVATYFLERVKERGCLQGNGRICVLDSDRGRSSLYAKENDDDEYGFDFDLEILKSFSPLDYINALFTIDNMGYSLIIVDTATPEWSGKNGTLDRLGKIVASSKSKNAFIAWPQVNPDHYSFVEFLMSLNAHLVCGLMAKRKLVMDGSKVESVGTKPIQREDFEREFDAIGMLDSNHNIKFTKGRCPALSKDVVFKSPGKDLGYLLADWMLRGSGECKAPEGNLPYQYIKEIKQYQKDLNYSDDLLAKAIRKRGVESGKIDDLNVEAAMDLVRVLRDKMLVANNTKTITDSLDRAAEHNFALEQSLASSNGVINAREDSERLG